jgi:hypothetical protein
MAAAEATLSEPTLPSWGMKATASLAARVRGDRPRSSWPRARHTSSLKATSWRGVASSASSMPTSWKPSSFTASMAVDRSGWVVEGT